ATRLSLHDERSALAERRGGILQHTLLVLEGQKVQDVDDRHRVAVRGLILDDVADLEPEPPRVADGGASDLDLALVEVDPEHASLFGGLTQQAWEETVARAEV